MPFPAGRFGRTRMPGPSRWLMVTLYSIPLRQQKSGPLPQHGRCAMIMACQGVTRPQSVADLDIKGEWPMNHVWVCLLGLALGCAAVPPQDGLERALRGGPEDFLEQAVVGPLGDGAYVVPTTQIVRSAGDMVLLPGRPVGVAYQPGGRLIAVKNRQTVDFLDATTHELRQSLNNKDGGASFHGLSWTADGTGVWITTATRFLALASAGDDGQFAWTRAIELPGPGGKGDSVPGGFALDEAANRAYVALSRNNSVAVVDLASGTVMAEIPVGIAPYGVLRIGDRLFVTNWGGRRPEPGELTGPTSGSEILIDERGIASSGTVTVIDVAAQAAVAEIETGLHPSGMAADEATGRLYVANANSDSVTVIDLDTLAVTATFSTRPMATMPFGSAPNALALGDGGGMLYVANGGNNCIAVLDTESGGLRGLIPTGWYPGELVVSADGKTLVVANTKGVGSRLRDDVAVYERMREYMGRPIPEAGFNTHQHMGSVSFIPVPDDAALQDHTYEAAANMRLPMMHDVMHLPKAEPRVVPVPSRPGEVSPIKHVVYIIKENRTYDQIFGELPQGNGDPALCHFPREVTPNHHALAEEFVLLDNFYCNGVLSADGHQWTNEGYVTDYIEKSFGGFTRSYPYDGDDAMAYASSGFIWDHVKAKGLTIRCYGEMVQAEITPNDATWTDIYNDYLNGTRNVEIRATTLVEGLKGSICPDFIGFPGKVQDVYRAEAFLRELRECEERGEWYNFSIMLLPNDHTVGTRPGYPTPRAAVADNDLALGRIVEAITKSPFWPETAIFVVQDDPQAGLDHVDGHRTVAFCISPYTRRGTVDSTHYNQNSMLRTMELILGLAPMNQLNLAANPMFACFGPEPDLTPYVARPNQIPLDELNPDVAALRGLQRRHAIQSLEMPLDDIDMADEDTLNRIIWHSVKGYEVPYPILARRPIVGAEYWGLDPAEIEED